MDEGKEKGKTDGRSAGADDGKADFVPQRRTAAGLEAITMSTSTRGCPHGCIYCDSRSECYGVEHFSQVRAKRDALDLLRKNSWHPAEKEVWWQPVQCPTHTIRWKKNKD